MPNLGPSRQNAPLTELFTPRVPRLLPLVPGKAVKADAGMLELLPHPLDPSEQGALGEAPGQPQSHGVTEIEDRGSRIEGKSLPSSIFCFSLCLCGRICAR